MRVRRALPAGGAVTGSLWQVDSLRARDAKHGCRCEPQGGPFGPNRAFGALRVSNALRERRGVVRRGSASGVERRVFGLGSGDVPLPGCARLTALILVRVLAGEGRGVLWGGRQVPVWFWVVRDIVYDFY